VFADVYHNYNEVVEPILQLFSSITSLLLCYLSEVCAVFFIETYLLFSGLPVSYLCGNFYRLLCSYMSMMLFLAKFIIEFE